MFVRCHLLQNVLDRCVGKLHSNAHAKTSYYQRSSPKTGWRRGIQTGKKSYATDTNELAYEHVRDLKMCVSVKQSLLGLNAMDHT